MPKKNKKNILKLVVLLILAGAAIFLILKLSPGAVPLPQEQVESILPIVIDSSVLGTQKFKDLRGFGQYPVRPGKTGRVNPFVQPDKEELLRGENDR